MFLTRTGMLLLCACILAAFSKPATAAAATPEPVTVLSEPIALDPDKPERVRFGKLTWLGTLRLSAEHKKFGGFSALAMDAQGKTLLAVTDTGRWLRAELAYLGGHPEKIIKAKMGLLTGLGGRRFGKKSDKDSEGLALDEPGALIGKAYISFERKHRIAVHDITKDGIGPARHLLRLPVRARSAKGNRGIEAIAKLRAGPSKGALLAFTEEYLDDKGDHIGWLIGGPAPGMLTLKRRGGFAVTDMASLGNGDVVVLERRFRFSEGVKMRLRLIKASAIRPGAILDGEVLFKADQSLAIDNMEGLAAHTDDTGRIILTVISDDNFNRTLQRTLLMQFALTP